MFNRYPNSISKDINYLRLYSLVSCIPYFFITSRHKKSLWLHITNSPLRLKRYKWEVYEVFLEKTIENELKLTNFIKYAAFRFDSSSTKKRRYEDMYLFIRKGKQGEILKPLNTIRNAHTFMNNSKTQALIGNYLSFEKL